MLNKKSCFSIMFVILLLIFSGCSGSDTINYINGQSENILEESWIFEVTAELSGEYDFNWTYYLYAPERIR